MKDFFKFLFASLVGQIISGIILFFIFLGIFAGMLGGASQQPPTKVSDNSILHLTFKNAIVDRSTKEDIDIQQLIQGGNGTMGLNTIVKSIRNAKEDPRIKGMYMDFGAVQAGQATLNEIREALLDFKSSGKFMVSYAEFFTQSGYYLASTADEIYVYPEGGIDFKGFSAELMFFKGFLDKMDVEMQVIRGKNNKFKSAVEPFMLDHMSAANRLQTERFLGGLWSHLVSGIADSRNLSVAALNEMADSIQIQTASDAVEYKLADGTMYKDEVLDLLKEKVEAEDDELTYVSLKKYAKAKPQKEDDEDEDEGASSKWKKKKVAVVYAVGGIESGNGDDATIGSERISKAIRKARKDSSVSAIVLRVNSPGGSALASDVIWRETVLAKAEKPFIVSMGDVAASGGYYIACAADKIYANPNTITGSIGVFGTMPNVQKLLEEKLSINVETVKTNTHADLGSINRPLEQEEYDIIQKSVENVYATFLDRVATGRGMTSADVDSIGQGRVWSGMDAKDIGLIDAFGTLDSAVAEAARMAELEANAYRIVEYPEQKSKLEEILKEITGETKTAVAKDVLGDQVALYHKYKEFQSIINMRGVQARLPYFIEIK